MKLQNIICSPITSIVSLQKIKLKRSPKLGNLHFGTARHNHSINRKLITIQLYTPLVIASLFLLCHLHVRIRTYVLLKVALHRA